MKNKSKINQKMTFYEVIKKHPESVEVFIKEGMYCIGCPMSSMETLEQGCKGHGINPDKLIEKLNKKIKENLKNN